MTPDTITAIKKALEGVTPRTIGYLVTSKLTGETRLLEKPLDDIPFNRDRFECEPLVLASTLESLQRESAALKIDASNHAADADTVRREREVERRRAEAAEAEVNRLRERLDIGPQGEDAIDVAESAADFLRHRAETAEARVKSLEEALKPFTTVSENWVDDEGWSDRACQHDRIVDWFGPSDFRRARTTLSSTGDTHGN
ncbi:hypothetical protein JZX86_05660 [Agrobacterium rosae]|uniref:hypothetical protein n=1 Tax=Agrobacterium rosae TaxID=1972867 RepID=UPI0019D32E1F|nr:hypothetical protein [Agrobacterium rosae]MBN7804849.1 hypothetical protein [Agrobacterium rosae]